jgi:hypothetical protein
VSCVFSQLNTSDDLKDYLDSIITSAAQYNHPPEYPVSVICRAIDGAAVGNDTLGQIYAGVVAYKGDRSCYDVNEYNYPTETNEGWKWQGSPTGQFFGVLKFDAFKARSTPPHQPLAETRPSSSITSDLATRRPALCLILMSTHRRMDHTLLSTRTVQITTNDLLHLCSYCFLSLCCYFM